MRIIVIVHPFNEEKYLKFDMVKLKIHSPNLTEKKEMLELPLFSQFAVQSLKRTTKSKKKRAISVRESFRSNRLAFCVNHETFRVNHLAFWAKRVKLFEQCVREKNSQLFSFIYCLKLGRQIIIIQIFMRILLCLPSIQTSMRLKNDIKKNLMRSLFLNSINNLPLHNSQKKFQVNK